MLKKDVTCKQHDIPEFADGESCMKISKYANMTWNGNYFPMKVFLI